MHGWGAGTRGWNTPRWTSRGAARLLDATGLLLEMVGADSPPGVSDDTTVSSELEKRSTATTEALMRAEGEPTGAGRA